MGQDDEVGEGEDPGELTPDDGFETRRSRDVRNERRILWSQVVIVIIGAVLLIAYLLALRWV